MKNTNKYNIGFYPPPQNHMKWANSLYIKKAPDWCSVDLRDGNQSLVVPMSLSQKLEFFLFLVKLGFKEIEIGFPAACDTEYEFCRALIEGDLIPDDVTIQVLTQSREHIIRKSFEALQGAKSAIMHFYNSTSVVQREQVFGKSKREIVQIATDGAKLVKQFAQEYAGNFRFQYSPESFTATEPEFALEICNEVLSILKPAADNKVIINLPVTVQVSMPHVYAGQIEYMCENLHNRKNVIVSLHPHNDRGCAVADTEMGLLAGADRVEGTLFGNGERTGNADIITLALNMYSQGIDPGLNLNNIPEVVEIYERLTGMDVHQRHPYCGELVFAAFSGSHQDAIAKSMAFREERKSQSLRWSVPYLPVDPTDLGRRYDTDVIRINSQSGKGGIGYILRRSGVELPARMRESAGYAVKDISDKLRYKEMCPDEVYNAFCSAFVNIETRLKLISTHYTQQIGAIRADVKISFDGKQTTITGTGNGRLDAVSDAIRRCLGIEFNITFYSEHSMPADCVKNPAGSAAKAMSYIEINDVHWGAGLHTDIITSSTLALISAINTAEAQKEQIV
jgi:2-isopropylmalate synthase